MSETGERFEPDEASSRLEDVFEGALNVQPAARREFVASACGGDSALEDEVLSLLAANERASGPLDVPLSQLFAPLLVGGEEQGSSQAGHASGLDDPGGGPGADGGEPAQERSSTAAGQNVGPYRILRELGRGLRASFPDGHVRTATALLGRGRLLARTGRAADGEPLLREALAMREAVLGADEAQTVEARQALGDCLVAQDRFADAEPLLLQAWGALDGKRYVERQRRGVAASLAALYDQWGRPGDARPYRLMVNSAAPTR